MTASDLTDDHSDAYLNAATGLASARDKSSHTFAAYDWLPPQRCQDLYLSDGIAARVVDRIVDDAMRADWRIAGDVDADTLAWLESRADDLGVTQALADAWRWARLYGYSIAVIATTDAATYDQPLDPRTMTDVRAVHVIEGPAAMPVYDRGYGLGDSAYSRPTHYEITRTGGKVTRVHSSRCILFRGVRLPPMYQRAMASRMGASVYQQSIDRLKALGAAMGYSESMMHEASVMVLKMADYRALCSGPQGSQTYQTMLSNMRFGLSNLGTLVLDKNDEYVESKRSLSDLPALIETFAAGLSWATGIPRTVLLGAQPGGLATNDGEMRSWYDSCARARDTQITPPLTRVLDMMLRARANRGGAPAPAEWTLEWGSLWEPTDSERATYEQTMVATSTALVSAGLSSPDEEREKLIGLGIIVPLPDSLEPLDEPGSLAGELAGEIRAGADPGAQGEQPLTPGEAATDG